MMPDCMIADCQREASHLCSNSTPRCGAHCLDIPESERAKLDAFYLDLDRIRKELYA